MFVFLSPHHKSSKAGEELLVKGPCGVTTFQPALWEPTQHIVGKWKIEATRRKTPISLSGNRINEQQL